jgi:hypothetical protein
MATSVDANPPPGDYGPWNPGVLSEVPGALRPLATILRPGNVSTPVVNALELQQLTGLPLCDLVAFEPRRLVLHEALVRVTADFSVPDGSRIEDLGINFREIMRLLLAQYLEPQMGSITAAFAQARRQIAESISAGLDDVVSGVKRSPEAPPRLSPFARLFARGARQRVARHGEEPPRLPDAANWGFPEITACERRAGEATEAIRSVSYRCLARVMSALFTTQGQPWGTRDLIVSLATDIACNAYGSEVIGRTIEPILQRAAAERGYPLLPSQQQPVVINTKGPSASGKSTLRPLQKRLTGTLGVRWSDFALISPDIWRKQLLDYASLGNAYKYAGALTSEELQIVDQKLDRYMAVKQQRGSMSHLLIDRFRFDSFAEDSDEAGSNLLTRFGRAIYLFYMITPPELLVERAWKRGLEVGRYKAVDDTLAHSVEAYTGMPNVFFTWIQRRDKQIHFEFLDNSVRFGELPRTVAFGSNDTLHVLDVARMVDIERFGRVNVDARNVQTLYPDRRLLAPEYNLGFLRKCLERFRQVIFAHQETGRVYLRVVSGVPTLVDREALQTALEDSCTGECLRVVAPAVLDGSVAGSRHPQYVQAPETLRAFPTIGQWGGLSRA